MKAHKRERPQYMPYPPCQGSKTGIKVGWRFYLKLEDAEKASEAAIWNGKIQASLGYDFGYQAPGNIEPDRWPSPVKGKEGFWVTIP